MLQNPPKPHKKPKKTRSRPYFILIGWLPITLFQMLNFYHSLHSKTGLIIIKVLPRILSQNLNHSADSNEPAMTTSLILFNFTICTLPTVVKLLVLTIGYLQAAWIFTACVRTYDGRLCFHRCVSVQLCGGGYPIPGLGRGGTPSQV